MIPVVSNDEKIFCAIPGKEAWDFVLSLKSLQYQLEYEPGWYVHKMDSIPKLIIIADKDQLVPEHLIKKAFDQLSQPKKLIFIEGGHFSPYLGKLSEISSMSTQWFKEKL
jgi:uncharacterized protein